MARKSYEQTNPDKVWIRQQMELRNLNLVALSTLIFGSASKSGASRLISGERDLRPEEAVTLANLFFVTVDEIYKRFDLPTPTLPSDSVPVIGTIRADRSVHLAPGGNIPLLAKAPSDTVAVRQTSAGAFKGWCFYYVPAETVLLEAMGHNSIVSRAGRPDVVCIISRSRKKDRYNLQIEKSTGTEVVEDAEVTAATPVLGGVLA